MTQDSLEEGREKQQQEKKQQQQQHISLLSSSLIRNIFGYLECDHLCHVLTVCKRFALHQHHKPLWKSAFLNKWLRLSSPPSDPSSASSPSPDPSPSSVQQQQQQQQQQPPSPNNLPPKISPEFSWIVLFTAFLAEDPILDREINWKDLSKSFVVEVKDEPEEGAEKRPREGEKKKNPGFVWKKGEVYIGHWEEGVRQGRGLQVTPTWLYFGDWHNNLSHGSFGFSLSPDGDSYLGEWKNGHHNGRGIKKWVKENDYYEGEWENDEREGIGSYYWGSSGASYSGSWKKGQISGRGTYVYSGGDCKYTGEWEEAKYNGEGHLSFGDGEFYSGHWQNDLKHGLFHTKTSFGTSYIGMYGEDQFHGEGTFTHPDSFSWTGKWVHNVPESDEAHHPKLSKCLKEGKCTRTVTGSSPFYGQLLYKCFTCRRPDSEKPYLCQTCVNTCHKDHVLYEQKIWTVGRSFCTCCQCSPPLPL